MRDQPANSDTGELQRNDGAATATSLQRVREQKKRSRMPGMVFVSLLVSAGCFISAGAVAQTASTTGQASGTVLRDGQHDFDFNIGVWRTHVRRLVHPLSNSKEWIELDGTVRVRPIWNGRAQLEEIDAHGASGQLEGLTMFLYNAEAHQWGQYFASRTDGVLNPPLIGEFKNGRGELFDQESFHGRTILVRFVWSDITADAHHVEQSFSDDGGKTWEPNFIATLTRATATTAAEEPTWTRGSSAADGARDFDFHFGDWKTHIHRLKKPLTGSHTWTDCDGTSSVSRVWGGQASVFELQATGPVGHIEGIGLRLFNPRSRQWSLNWANGTDGVMTTPMIGGFSRREGHFFDQETFGQRVIMSRNGFSAITPKSSRFEQAFSDDGGKTWETNWIMTFTR